MSLMATGLAFISGPCTQLVMDALSPEQAGAGPQSTTPRARSAHLGVAVLGSIPDLGLRQRRDRPSHCARRARDVAQTASESVMAGCRPPPAPQGPIAEATRDAVQQVFTDGLRGAVWAAITVTALAAVAAAFLLRGARHSAVDDDDARAVVDPPHRPQSTTGHRPWRTTSRSRRSHRPAVARRAAAAGHQMVVEESARREVVHLLPLCGGRRTRRSRTPDHIGIPSDPTRPGPFINWKCRCGALELPVLPRRAMTCPAFTLSPGFTSNDPSAGARTPPRRRPEVLDDVVPTTVSTVIFFASSGSGRREDAGLVHPRRRASR